MATIPSGYTPLAKIGISDKGEYVPGTAYEKQDSVLYKGSTYVALIDNPVGEPTNDGMNWRYLAKGFPDDINEVEFTFTEATARENIQTGEKSNIIMGKIKKWFADLTVAAFAQVISYYADMMSNTVDGYLVDALAVKEGFDTVNSNLDKRITNGVQMYNLMNVSTIRIQASSVEGNYGSVFVCANGACCLLHINGKTFTKTDITENSITIYTSDVYTYVNLPSPYSHGFVVVSGQIGYSAKITQS